MIDQEERLADSWQTDQLATLYEAILKRMVFTYMLNELVKSGVKTDMKTGLLDFLRKQQLQQNLIITNTVRRIDRGTRE